jgi:hypothetical protein
VQPEFTSILLIAAPLLYSGTRSVEPENENVVVIHDILSVYVPCCVYFGAINSPIFDISLVGIVCGILVITMNRMSWF